MSARRTARVASVIREVVSTSILQELRDPRIQHVTVLGAEVSPDLRYASIRISVMGDDKMAALTMHGLNSARGYLQSKVAERIKSRYTPELRFVLDSGVRKSIEASRILREVFRQDGEHQEQQASSAVLSDTISSPAESASTDEADHNEKTTADADVSPQQTLEN